MPATKSKSRKPARKIKRRAKDVTFKHGPIPEVRTFEDVRDRVVAACAEFNAALLEAYDLTEMRVEIVEGANRPPMQLHHAIYRRVDMSDDFTRAVAEERLKRASKFSMEWRAVTSDTIPLKK